MVARNENVSVPARTWTQLTVDNITAIRVQHDDNTQTPLYLQATVGAVAPTGAPNGAIAINPGVTLAADLTLAQVWPGVSGANRVYAWSAYPVSVSVSHA